MEFSLFDEPNCEVLTKVKKITPENPTKNIPNKVLHRFFDESTNSGKEIPLKLFEVKKDPKVGAPRMVSANFTWKLISQDFLSEETKEMKKKKMNQSILLNGFCF